MVLYPLLEIFNMTDINQIQKNVETINTKIASMGEKIQSAIDSGDKAKLKEVADQVRMMKTQLFGLKRDKVEKMLKAKSPDKPMPAGEDYSVTKLWGDQRMNPYWLKTAEYFNIKEKEFNIAQSKISAILDWAANKGKTRKIGEILGIIGSTLKKLQSPGLSDRSYAVLHRYIVLSKEKETASPEVKKEIEKEISAYTS